MSFNISPISKETFDAFMNNALSVMPVRTQYHNSAHALEIVEKVQTLLEESQNEYTGYDFTVVTIAALYHDTGYSNGGVDGHEERSGELFSEQCTSLRESGHDIPDNFEDDVYNAIQGTVFLQEPETEYGAFLSDADVWNFGAEWDIFYSATVDAKDEFAPEVPIDDWIAFRGFILQKHSYYTDSGIELYQDKKEENIAHIKEEYGLLETPPWE